MTGAPAPAGFDAAEWAARDYPTKAIWGLVFSFAGLFVPPLGAVGVVLGWTALKRIDREGRRGRGIALAAIIVGALDLIALAVVAIMLL